MVEIAKKALCDGHCVVIGLQSTGEAGLDAVMRDAGVQPGDSVKELVVRRAASIFARRLFARRLLLLFFFEKEKKTSPVMIIYML